MEKIIKKGYKEVEVEVEKYTSIDGRIFDTQEECLKYEEVLKKEKETKEKYSISDIRYKLSVIDGKDLYSQFVVEIKEPVTFTQLLNDLDYNFSYYNKVFYNDISLEIGMKQDLIQKGKYVIAIYNLERNNYIPTDQEIFISSKEHLLKQVNKLKDKIEKL